MILLDVVLSAEQVLAHNDNVILALLALIILALLALDRSSDDPKDPPKKG